jgi:hypothetical protein
MLRIIIETFDIGGNVFGPLVGFVLLPHNIESQGFSTRSHHHVVFIDIFKSPPTHSFYLNGVRV